MEYAAQVEKTFEILSFLLSKIPPDFAGQNAWLVNSLHVFINEIQQQHLSKEEDKFIPELILDNLSDDNQYNSEKLIEYDLNEPIGFQDDLESIPRFVDNKFNIKKHVKIEASKKLKGPLSSFQFHCCLCYHNFKTREELTNHDLEHHFRNNVFFCNDCDFTAIDKKDLTEHYADQHKNGNIFLIKNLANKSYKGKGYRKLRYCTFCDQIFIKTAHLRKHLIQSHNQTVPKNKCLICFREFDTERSVKGHMDDFHIGLKIKCNGWFCDKIFSTDSEYQTHYSERHQRSDHTCHICGEEFKMQGKEGKVSVRAAFNRHIDSHSMTKPTFKCQRCDKTFFFEVDLNKHLNHTTHGGRIFPCSICDYISGSNRVLKRHVVENHSTERPFECDKCGKRFSNKIYLGKHLSVHEEVRKYECSFCGKKFKYKKHVNVHEKIHRQEYTAECEICDAKFVQKQNKKLHMKKHHPEVF